MSDGTDRTPANRQESDDWRPAPRTQAARPLRRGHEVSQRTAKAKGEDDGNDSRAARREARRRVVVRGGAASVRRRHRRQRSALWGRTARPVRNKPQGRKLPLTERGRDTGRSEFARSAWPAAIASTGQISDCGRCDSDHSASDRHRIFYRLNVFKAGQRLLPYTGRCWGRPFRHRFEPHRALTKKCNKFAWLCRNLTLFFLAFKRHWLD
jgi:hypothetical protein